MARPTTPPDRLAADAQVGQQIPERRIAQQLPPFELLESVQFRLASGATIVTAHRVSQGNTEHLPAAEGPAVLPSIRRESRPDPPTSYSVETSRNKSTRPSQNGPWRPHSLARRRPR